MVYELKNPAEAEKLFAEMNDTLILSCLQGVMGKIYSTEEESCRSAMAVLGDFCFLAGTPVKELVKAGMNKKKSVIMVPENENWAEIIEQVYSERAVRKTRYAIKKENGVFDVEKLRCATRNLPEGYEIKAIDEKLYNECLKNSWSRDFVAQYASYNEYEKLGLGFAAIQNGELVAGVSSYSSYRDGIEIEIVTRQDHRRRGLAYACAATLIVECLSRGLYPSWDAANLWSVALAEKLGYHFSHEYPVYTVTGE